MRSARVLLYSGGMDSLITAQAYPDAKLLYCNTRASYANKELLYLAGNAPRAVEIDERLNLAGEERDQFIVPMRNLFLICMAALHGDQILLAATAGDPSLDKDEIFAAQTSALLGRVCSDPCLPDFGKVEVLLPYKSMSKAQMVKDYLGRGGDPQRLADSVSCYHPSEKHCGRCETCFRKWVALRLSGLESLVNWSVDPASNNWQYITDKIETGGWHGEQEDKDTKEALWS